MHVGQYYLRADTIAAANAALIAAQAEIPIVRFRRPADPDLGAVGDPGLPVGTEVFDDLGQGPQPHALG